MTRVKTVFLAFSTVANLGKARPLSDRRVGRAGAGVMRIHRRSSIVSAPRRKSLCGQFILSGMTDPIIARIESLACRRGRLHAERRNRGYKLYRASYGAPAARLRPTGTDDRVAVLYWSLWKERWTQAGPFGKTALPLQDALR